MAVSYDGGFRSYYSRSDPIIENRMQDRPSYEFLRGQMLDLQTRLSQAIIPQIGDLELLQELRLYLHSGEDDIIDRELEEWEKRRQNIDKMILRYIEKIRPTVSMERGVEYDRP